MATTPLLAPTNVNSVAAADGSKVTVSWQDPNAPGTVANYTVSFVAQDKSAPAFPDQTSATISKDIPRKSGDTPTAADLASKYTAQVVAIAKDATKNTNSAAGVQSGAQPSGPTWDVSLSIDITLGDNALTLTRPATGTGGGIYRLPVTKDKPYKITIEQIRKFVAGIDKDMADKLPQNWPGDTKITGELDITKLAVDLDKKLFALDIKVPLNFTPITGLTVQSVELGIARTDGTDL